jgi:septal ring factor EnvC (AmiA/AmiB activator)
MKILKFTFIISLCTLIFCGCSSKSQDDMIDSNKQDISQLLKTLIQKEKEINNLNRELENCKNSK